MSPLTNRRTDEYGGSRTGRARFLNEVLDAVRSRVGNDFVVGVRIPGDQFDDGGLHIDEMKEIARELATRHQIDFFNVSYYHNNTFGPAGNSIVPMYVPEGQFVYLATAIKEAVGDTPVICVNRILDPRMADAIVREGRADAVAMTRAQIADPHLANKARSGQLENIRPCIGINEGCMGQVMAGSALPMTCAINPSAGREHEHHSAPMPKSVVVVGGGIAGLEFARAAAERGHTVSLFEASDRLGGQLNLAAKIPRLGAMVTPVAYFSAELRRLGVETHLNSPIGAADPALDGADVIAVATGSMSANWLDSTALPAPNMPTMTVREAFIAEHLPRRVAIFATDQTMEALGLADYLSEQGAAVLFATSAPGFGAQVENQTRPFILDRLTKAGVELATLTTLAVDAAGKAILVRGDNQTSIDVEEEFDLLIPAFGAVANPNARTFLDDDRVILIGDAYAPRRIVAATQQAYSAAMHL